jgi:PAS domain S-box-containing protein
MTNTALASYINANNSSVLMVIIAALLGLQWALIVGLQRSRVSNKKARLALAQSQKALADKVAERTKSLHASNEQLHQETQGHEATALLLREAQEHLHSIINSMPSVIIGVNHRGLVTHWNAAAEHKTGVTAASALGQPVQTLYPSLPVDTRTIDRTIATGESSTQQNVLLSHGGKPYYYDLTVSPLIAAQAIGAVIRVDDVSVRVQMENMMIQSEKMLSLGQLAAGMAHEINNPLSIILHGVQNIYRRISPELSANQEAAAMHQLELGQLRAYFDSRDITQFLEDIRGAGERSAAIVSNMLNFSRRNAQSQELFDLGQAVRQSVELLAAERNHMPPVTLEIDPALPLVYGCAAELQQVVLNLVRNANQALQACECSSPSILVRLTQAESHVRMLVQDNGPGMSDEVARHIFEPFYTTKPAGQGTGLGLSVCYFIITEHHDGSIAVESTPGQGTLFTICLPNRAASPPQSP